MTMTSVDVNDELLEAARKELGTDTKRDTINEALKIIATRQERIAALFAEGEEIDYTAFGVGADIVNPEIMRGARR